VERSIRTRAAESRGLRTRGAPPGSGRAPTWRLRGNRILIECKDDIRRRLGSPTDGADVVILAWHQREHALMQASGKRKLNPSRAFGRGAGPLAWTAS
jgi:hypothetical protein